MDTNEGRKMNMEKARQEPRGGFGKGEMDERGN